jgi:hypothetical protein
MADIHKLAKKLHEKIYRVSSTGMMYSYEIEAKSRTEAEKKFREEFKNQLTGEEEIIFD